MSPEGRSFESLTLKPQHIEAPGGNKAEFIPARGGLIASLKLRGKEVLFMNQATLMNPNKNVRGGIPVLFPNAGKAENLEQHGFARKSKDWTYSIAPDKKSFTESFHSSPDTEEQYPYKFILEVSGEFDNDKFYINQHVQNLSERAMPIAMGLHPYFPVPHADKWKTMFTFAGGEEIEKRKDEWMNGTPVVIDNPKRHALNADMRIFIPGLGNLVLEASSEYKKIVVWSEKDQSFICIEPFMRDQYGLNENPEFVPPGDFCSAYLSIKLER